MSPITFKGWWAEAEKSDVPEPWEHFTVVLHGRVALDYVPHEDLAEVLRASGYRLVLEKIK
ncbi:MAG: hypothetical protein JKY94_09140, partial [Rhodobacteraceae bacterium]|nr:hypothetical protein [Paracoccaceae bacterium]